MSFKAPPLQCIAMQLLLQVTHVGYFWIVEWPSMYQDLNRAEHFAVTVKYTDELVMVELSPTHQNRIQVLVGTYWRCQ